MLTCYRRVTAGSMKTLCSRGHVSALNTRRPAAVEKYVSQLHLFLVLQRDLISYRWLLLVLLKKRATHAYDLRPQVGSFAFIFIHVLQFHAAVATKTRNEWSTCMKPLRCILAMCSPLIALQAQDGCVNRLLLTESCLMICSAVLYVSGFSLEGVQFRHPHISRFSFL